VAVITETHFKPSKQPDSMTTIAGYTKFRRDFVKRRGGGVAIYMRDDTAACEVLTSYSNPTYELLLKSGLVFSQSTTG